MMLLTLVEAGAEPSEGVGNADEMVCEFESHPDGPLGPVAAYCMTGTLQASGEASEDAAL